MNSMTTEISQRDIGAIDARLKACMGPINEILIAHGLGGKIGLEILHTHFPVAADELMYESVDENNRTVSFTPVKRDSVTDKESFVSAWNPGTGQPVKRCPRTASCHQILS